MAVEGAGGVSTNVIIVGPIGASEIFLIHGTGQSYPSWGDHLQTELGDETRLVAFDKRGHGNSGKTWKDANYTDSQSWADNFTAVIGAAEPKKVRIVAAPRDLAIWLLSQWIDFFLIGSLLLFYACSL